MSLRAPRHHQAITYARSGLFKGLRAFSELERRIEQLPTEKERGDAFEVFVKAHLNTDETAQADEVWVTANVPPEIGRARVSRLFNRCSYLKRPMWCCSGHNNAV